jgi:acetyltransferase
MLGMAHLLGDADGTRSEFAVVVSDPVQRLGIGGSLLGRCLWIAKKRGIKSVWGLILRDNIAMITLGRELGFSMCRVPYCDELELKIDLEQYTGRGGRHS